MNRPTGPITPLEVTRDESRGNTVLPSCWVRTSDSHATPASSSSLVPISNSLEALPLIDSGSAVLILLGPHSPDEARAFVARAANAKAHVYVLAQHGEIDENSVTNLGLDKGARALVRRVSSLPVSGILVDHGEYGGLFLAPPGVPAQWWLPLSKDQGQAAFRYALHKFWHEASDEGAIENAKVHFVKARERPFDIPLPTSDALVGPASGSKGARAFWYSPTGQLPPGKCPTSVIVPPSGEHHDALMKLVRAGAEASWLDLGLPAFTLGKQRPGTVFVGDLPTDLQIELVPDQIGAFQNLVEEVAEAPAWRFVIDARLGDLNGEVQLAGDTVAASIIDDHEVHCGSMPADSVRAMPNIEPPVFPSLAPLVRKVCWAWTVEPPQAPKNAKQAPLCAMWQKLDADVKARMKRVDTRLSEVERESDTLGKRFETLVSALLGFGRTRASLNKRRIELATKTPSGLGPMGATKLLDDLQSIEKELEELCKGVEQAEHEAMVNKDKEEQRAAFANAKKRAKRDVEQHEKNLAKAGKVLENIKAHLDGLEKLPRKDRRANHKKFGDEEKKTKRTIDSLEYKLEAARSTVKEKFCYRPDSTSSRPKKTDKKNGPRFVPNERHTVTTTTPDEALPQLGRLLAHKQQRFLAIANWEQLDEGEAEAKRLGALLVAEKR